MVKIFWWYWCCRCKWWCRCQKYNCDENNNKNVGTGGINVTMLMIHTIGLASQCWTWCWWYQKYRHWCYQCKWWCRCQKNNCDENNNKNVGTGGINVTMLMIHTIGLASQCRSWCWWYQKYRHWCYQCKWWFWCQKNNCDENYNKNVGTGGINVTMLMIHTIGLASQCQSWCWWYQKYRHWCYWCKWWCRCQKNNCDENYNKNVGTGGINVSQCRTWCWWYQKYWHWCCRCKMMVSMSKIQLWWK
jgi:hypothetical protein